MRLLLFCTLALGAGLPGQGETQKGPPPLTEEEKILHVLSRLTFGPRPGDVARVRDMGLDRWIDHQLAGDPRNAEERARWQGRFRTLGMTPKELEAFHTAQQEEGEMMSAERSELYNRSGREIRAVIAQRGLTSDAQLVEVLADFWRNHFAVDLSKDTVLYTTSHYEEHVIRSHVFSPFEDLLMATARHPSMLVFLDNHLSRRPPSDSELRMIERQSRRQGNSREAAKEQAAIARQRGLNENYARELLELHTLGVDNGYTQDDVEQLARALTGWSVDLNGDGTGFLFREEMHDPSRKRILGREVPRGRGQSGASEAEWVIQGLAHHKNTAGFIATKLCRYLVHDDPPAAVVAAAAETFKKSKGDLREVVRSIITHPAFFSRENYKAKFKTPLEFVLSAVRATEAEVSNPDDVVSAVARLGMPIYGCEDPTGWYDTAEAWRDPGVMALRWRFALDMAQGRVPGVKIAERFYYGLPTEDPLDLLDHLIRRVVPQGLGSNTYAVLERTVFRRVQEGRVKTDEDRMSLAKTIVGILLGSPEFQQQ